jgi:hypothetical protein
MYTCMYMWLTNTAIISIYETMDKGSVILYQITAKAVSSSTSFLFHQTHSSISMGMIAAKRALFVENVCGVRYEFSCKSLQWEPRYCWKDTSLFIYSGLNYSTDCNPSCIIIANMSSVQDVNFQDNPSNGSQHS